MSDSKELSWKYGRSGDSLRRDLESFGCEEITLGGPLQNVRFVYKGHRFDFEAVRVDESRGGGVVRVTPVSTTEYPDVFVPLRDIEGDDVWVVPERLEVSFHTEDTLTYVTKKIGLNLEVEVGGTFDHKVYIDGEVGDERVHDLCAIRELREEVEWCLDGVFAAVVVFGEKAPLEGRLNTYARGGMGNVVYKGVLDRLVRLCKALPPVKVEHDEAYEMQTRWRGFAFLGLILGSVVACRVAYIAAGTWAVEGLDVWVCSAVAGVGLSALSWLAWMRWSVARRWKGAFRKVHVVFGTILCTALVSVVVLRVNGSGTRGVLEECRGHIENASMDTDDEVQVRYRVWCPQARQTLVESQYVRGDTEMRAGVPVVLVRERGRLGFYRRYVLKIERKDVHPVRFEGFP